MPTYSYECSGCGHKFDVFHGINATPALKCEECGSKKVVRQIGTGSGVIFKGGGFYETDYKTKKGKPPTEPKPEKKEGSTAGSTTGSESGSTAKGETKADTKASAKSTASPKE